MPRLAPDMNSFVQTQDHVRTRVPMYRAANSTAEAGASPGSLTMPYRSRHALRPDAVQVIVVGRPTASATHDECPDDMPMDQHARIEMCSRTTPRWIDAAARAHTCIMARAYADRLPRL